MGATAILTRSLSGTTAAFCGIGSPTPTHAHTALRVRELPPPARPRSSCLENGMFGCGGVGPSLLLSFPSFEAPQDRPSRPGKDDRSSWWSEGSDTRPRARGAFSRTLGAAEGGSGPALYIAAWVLVVGGRDLVRTVEDLAVEIAEPDLIAIATGVSRGRTAFDATCVARGIATYPRFAGDRQILEVAPGAARPLGGAGERRTSGGTIARTCVRA